MKWTGESNMSETKVGKEKLYLGIDIGGTAVKLGSVTETGQVVETESYQVDFDGYETPILQTVVESCNKFFYKYKRKTGEYQAIGVSATGAINIRTGVVDGSAGHIRNWEKSCIKDVLQSKFGIPVQVLNDANAAALGEAWIGAAKGKKDVVVVTIGTGVGGGILVNRQILLGVNGFAGELGHMPIQNHGEACTCGNKGCLERYGSMTALIQRIKASVKAGNMKSLLPKEINGESIFSLAEEGNAQVLEILDQWMDDLAAGIIGLVHIFNPEQVLIGGGVSRQEKLFVEPLRKKVVDHIMPHFLQNFELRAAKLGNHAGMIGAVYYCKQQY